MSYTPISNYTLDVFESLCKPLSHFYNFTGNATIELNKSLQTDYYQNYCTHIDLPDSQKGKICVVGINMTKEFITKHLNILACDVKLQALSERIYDLVTTEEGFVHSGIITALGAATVLATSRAITAIKNQEYPRAIGWGLVGCSTLYLVFNQVKRVAGF